MEAIKDCSYMEIKMTNAKKEAAKIVYISGPMTGLPNLNYDAFYAKEAELVAKGYTVLNPARMGEELKKSNPNPNYEEFMQNDLNAIKEMAQAICFLPGWTNSKGAMREARLAMELGLPKVE